MKYYETNFDEYLSAVKKKQLHSEIDKTIQLCFKPDRPFTNVILYGPAGVGKYSQALNIIGHYCSSSLKYDKKVIINTDKNDKKNKTKNDDSKKTNTTQTTKNDFVIRISEFHYEVDMATLGCNSKTLWFDIFFQIIDIISHKPSKSGIILCKNFHMIYSELLDVFNSYVRHQTSNIQVHFIILTEQLSFIPDSISKSFEIIPIKRPSPKQYIEISKNQNKSFFGKCTLSDLTQSESELLLDKIIKIRAESIVNIREVNIIKSSKEPPEDVFNVVTDNLLTKILDPRKINIIDFRNDIYELLTYNIEIPEVIFYILKYIISERIMSKSGLNQVLKKTFTFFKYYNNNYRPIYHLENILFFIIVKIHFKKD